MEYVRFWKGKQGCLWLSFVLEMGSAPQSLWANSRCVSISLSHLYRLKLLNHFAETSATLTKATFRAEATLPRPLLSKTPDPRLLKELLLDLCWQVFNHRSPLQGVVLHSEESGHKDIHFLMRLGRFRNPFLTQGAAFETNSGQIFRSDSPLIYTKVPLHCYPSQASSALP